MPPPEIGDVINRGEQQSGIVSIGVLAEQLKPDTSTRHLQAALA